MGRSFFVGCVDVIFCLYVWIKFNIFYPEFPAKEKYPFIWNRVNRGVFWFKPGNISLLIIFVIHMKRSYWFLSLLLVFSLSVFWWSAIDNDNIGLGNRGALTYLWSYKGKHPVDEVRVHPKDAQMITRSFAYMIGVTSETDASGKTLYYEYNDFNDLKLIRDQDGRIVKQFDYQYDVNP